MKTFTIYWDDLTDEAKERLAELNHENIDQAPLAIIDIEDEEDWEDDEDDDEWEDEDLSLEEYAPV